MSANTGTDFLAFLRYAGTISDQYHPYGINYVPLGHCWYPNS